MDTIYFCQTGKIWQLTCEALALLYFFRVHFLSAERRMQKALLVRSFPLRLTPFPLEIIEDGVHLQMKKRQRKLVCIYDIDL